MMKICSISSGSSGNCIFVSSGKTRLLVDAGVSKKRIETELCKIGESIDNIDAILVTHEHGDHIKSIGVLARTKNIPVFGTKGTIDSAINGKMPIGDIDDSLVNYVTPDNDFCIGDISVSPFRVSHDASDPIAYCFMNDGKKIGFATDLGFYDDYIYNKLFNSDVLYIEANHDERMLEVGRYPYSLKQRIKGEKGHLSNDSCAELVVKLCNSSDVKLRDVILAHLSEENNFPELAFETVNSEVQVKVPEEKRPVVHVAPRNEHSYIADI